MKKYKLPSLPLLHTFEAVARRLSFTLAADELCLTQSAVSRQIKNLESELGQPLFSRKHRGIELTPAGKQLYDSVTRSLDELQDCIARLRTSTDTPHITIAMSIAFSYYWLMPRLERFSARHPDIDLRVLATDQLIDLHKENVDVAVLYGDGNWEGIAASRLFGERVYPVCSPDYLERHPQLSQAPDLLTQTLLHLEGGGNIWGAVDWQVWLANQGVNEQPARPGIRLNTYPMVLQGAEAGRGVALGWSYITDALLAEGRLSCPVPGAITTANSYYICTPEQARSNFPIASLLDWFLDEKDNPALP